MRGKPAPKRKIHPDAKFNNVLLGKLINYIMRDGKKTTAQHVVYDCFTIISKKSKQDAMAVFDEAIKNISPSVEVKGRRIGGANYQVPVVVTGDRKLQLAYRWLIEAARNKKGKTMAERLADELMAAAINEGDAIKKKQDVHRMAEANKAFAHFAR
ncbi:MAG: 30S ribosomal protein S7 [Candidatus Komeilibacteria bacterium]